MVFYRHTYTHCLPHRFDVWLDVMLFVWLDVVRCTALNSDTGRGLCSSGGCVRPSALLMLVLLPGAARDSFFSHLLAQILLWCLLSPHVSWHALTSVHTIKIPCIGRGTIVWTQESTAHIRSTLKDRMWMPKRQEN